MKRGILSRRPTSRTLFLKKESSISYLLLKYLTVDYVLQFPDHDTLNQ